MDFTNIEERMMKTISVFEENLSEIRAGRANPAILNKISIEDTKDFFLLCCNYINFNIKNKH